MMESLMREVENDLSPDAKQILLDIVNVYRVEKERVDILRKELNQIAQFDDVGLQSREFAQIVADGLQKEYVENREFPPPR